MKKTFIFGALLLATTVTQAQLLVGVFGTVVTPQAATPTFSPVAGAVTNPTTVTASSMTSGSGCTMYLDTNSTPATAQSTYSVTTPVTLYAQVRGCTGYGNSAIASASYTISVNLVVQTVNCEKTGSTYDASMNCPLSATAAGNSLIMFCSGSGGNPVTSTTPASVAIGTPVTDTSNIRYGVWIVSNVTTGTTNLAVNYSATYSQISCQVDELAGVVTTSPVDQAVGITTGSYGTGSATNVTGSITTTNANDVIMGFVAAPASSQTYTAGTGYTLIPQSLGGNAGYAASALEYKKVSSTGTFNPGMTWTAATYYATETFALKLQ